MAEDIRPETIRKVAGIKEKPEETISDVKKKTEDMDVIQGAIKTARQLSGAEELEGEIDRQDKKLDKVEAERDKAIEDKHKAEIDTVKSELGAKIDGLAKAYAGGAPKESIAEQIAEIKKAANELNMGGSKISEIKDMMNLISTLNPQKGLVEQIKDAKELISTLIPPGDKGSEFNIGGMPANIALELKKMDTNLQITLEQMKDDRQRRDQDFKLTLRKYDDERIARQQEVTGKIEIERERNELVAGGIETLGRAIGRGMAEAAQGTPGEVAGRQVGGRTTPSKSYHLDVAEGEFGEFECPTCKSKGIKDVLVSVGPTSTEAICGWCGSKYPVTRHPAAEVASETAPVEEAE